MKAEKAERRIACPTCRATVTQDTPFCWKCGSQLKTDGFESRGIELPDKPSGSAGFNFSIASLLLLTTLIAIFLALFAAAPGLGVFLAVLSIPPFVRTLMVVNRRKAMGQQVSGGRKAGLFLGSLGVTLLITWATMFAAAIAFFFSCLGAFAFLDPGASGGANVEAVFLWITIGFTLTFTGLVLWAFSFWIRARWRRDTKP